MDFVGNGFVLAGGEGRRMGRDKASLPYSGTTLVSRAAHTLTTCGLNVRVLVRPGQRLDDPRLVCIPDREAGLGPLGALATALELSDSAVNCFLPCDMPEVPASLFAHLVGHAADYDFVAPTDSAGRVQQLCAQLSPGCLGPINQLLLQGALRVDGLLSQPDLRVRLVPPEEHKLADRCFANLNKPSDLS